MAKTSLKVCLMLLVALRAVYGQEETLFHRIFTVPNMGKDLEPYAYNCMLDFVNIMEGKRTLAAPEFKNLFVKLRDYIDFCFKSASPRSIDFSVEMSRKSEQITMAMSALSGTKDQTSESWKLVDSLYSMGEDVVEMKRSGSKEITFEELRKLTWSIMKWAREINLFVKTASEKKGVSIDLSSFDKYYDSYVLDPAKGASDKTGRGHPSGRNVSKGTFANNNSNSTKPN